MNVEKELIDALEQISQASSLVEDAAERHGIPETSRWVERLRKLIHHFDEKATTLPPDIDLLIRVAAANGAMELALTHILGTYPSDNPSGYEITTMIREALDLQEKATRQCLKPHYPT